MTATAVTPTTQKTSTRPRLFTPGPVEIPVRILRAMSGIQPHHRTDAFRAVFHHDLAAVDVEVHAADREHPAVGFGDVLEFDQPFAHRRPFRAA